MQNTLLKDQPRTKLHLPQTRSTEMLRLRVGPEVRQRAYEEATRLGVPVGHWVAQVIMGRSTEYAPGFELQPLVVLAQHIMRAQATLESDPAAATQALDAARRLINETMYAHRDKFDAEMDRLAEGASSAMRG